MKVLFLTNIPSPYRVDFFQELGKLCDLTVLYELEKAKDRDAAWQKSFEIKSYKEVYLKSVVRQASSAWCPSVKRYLKDSSYDIIVVGVYSTPTGMYAVHYLKKHGRKYLLNCDGGIIASQERPIKRRLKTYLIGGAAGYLSTGAASDEYLEYYGARRANIYRYPFTSLRETDRLKTPITDSEKRERKEALGISESRIIVTVGNFIPRKGFDILLKAAGFMNTSYGIYLIGGEETEEYREIRENLRLKNIHYIPFASKERLQEYYRAADVFALPTREDIWGLVINEAMAAGLPVITTDRCAAGTELLEAKAIVPVEDEELLAGKITVLMENDAERCRQGERNLQKSREYTIERMARVHREIFGMFQEKNR